MLYIHLNRRKGRTYSNDRLRQESHLYDFFPFSLPFSLFLLLLFFIDTNVSNNPWAIKLNQSTIDPPHSRETEMKDI